MEWKRRRKNMAIRKNRGQGSYRREEQIQAMIEQDCSWKIILEGSWIEFLIRGETSVKLLGNNGLLKSLHVEEMFLIFKSRRG